MSASRRRLHLRSRLVTGLLFVLPFAATLWLVLLLVDVVDAVFGGVAFRLLGVEGEPGPLLVWGARGAGLVVLLALLYVLGVVARNVAGRVVLAAFDRAIGSIPLLGTLHLALRQVIDAVGESSSKAFRRCVALEYPRRGVWTLAFVTNEQAFRPAGAAAPPCLSLFVPTTPNPTSGFYLLVPEEECHPLALSVEDGIKMVVSAGIVLPPSVVGGGASRPATEGE